MAALTLKSGNEFEVSDADIIEWQRTYKSIDVTHELDKMAQWLYANPGKRKTQRGIKRFINSWLSRANENVQAGRSNKIAGLKPSGIDNATDLSWVGPDILEAKRIQYLKSHGSYWLGERKTQ